MEAINHPEGQYLFKTDFEASPGEHQYKFRLGPGDWWVCDETKPTIDDGAGNRNNLLLVSEAEQTSKQAAENKKENMASKLLNTDCTLN